MFLIDAFEFRYVQELEVVAQYVIVCIYCKIH